MWFDDMVTGHLEWIARKAFCFHARREDAEDLAQETLCRIYVHRDKYDPARDFKPWVLTIMTNIFKTWCTRRQRVSFTCMEDMEPPTAVGADERAIAREVISVVRRGARKSVCMECVLLYAKGYSYDEIAERTGLNPGTVKSRISAGRALVGRLLGKESRAG